MHHFCDEVRKLGIELLGEICSNFAMTMLFTEMFHSMVRVRAITAIHTDEDHILLINGIGHAPEKGVVNDGVLIWGGPHFPFTWEG